MKQGAEFLIVGLGVMGGSYAKALSEKGYRVTAVDRDEMALRWARANGLIQQGSAGDATQLVRQADYILLALYPKDILPWLERYAPALKPGALLTDLVGVKGCFVQQAQKLLPHNEYIPSHPMAGSEKTGVYNARPAMFQGANYLVVPTPLNTEQGIAFAKELAAELGFARVTVLSVAEHDAMIAYVSQLTHAIAVALMNTNDDPRVPEVTGDSFRDLTRIADINDELWSELFLANAPALSAQIEGFIAQLEAVKQAVDGGDREKLKALLQSSAQRRRSFNFGKQ